MLLKLSWNSNVQNGLRPQPLIRVALLDNYLSGFQETILEETSGSTELSHLGELAHASTTALEDCGVSAETFACAASGSGN